MSDDEQRRKREIAMIVRASIMQVLNVARFADELADAEGWANPEPNCLHSPEELCQLADETARKALHLLGYVERMNESLREDLENWIAGRPLRNEEDE